MKAEHPRAIRNPSAGFSRAFSMFASMSSPQTALHSYPLFDHLGSSPQAGTFAGLGAVKCKGAKLTSQDELIAIEGRRVDSPDLLPRDL